MPASWLITAPSRMQALDLESVALLLDAPREPTPARAMLAFVNRLAPVEFISLVTYASGGPELIEGHAQSAGLRNVVGECFARYRVLAVAPLLRQVHRNALGSPREGNGVQERIAGARRRLDARAAALSARERDVCARIACGISADGIAADLDVAPSTVLTLRKRAYQKLDIHSRLELVRLAG